jgi:aquaporin related protein
MFPSPFNVATSLGAGTSNAQGVWIEALCTAELVFTIIMLAKEKHRATFIAPVGIGLALFIAELVAVYYTGGSLNPARSFGPAAVGHDFLTSQWIYWVGPFIGSILAVLFYYLMKILEYEMANPGQDGDVDNDPTQNPDHKIAAVVEERQAEVEEIQAIEEEGGFENLTDNESLVEGSVEHGDAPRRADEVHMPPVRIGEPDLEAQWNTRHPSEGVRT